MYLKNPKFEGEFDGKKVTATLSQLTFEDALLIESIDESITDDKKNLEAAKIVAKILPSYVKEFDGPVDENGVKVTIDEVCQLAYFSRLMVAMGKKLVEASSPPQRPPAA